MNPTIISGIISAAAAITVCLVNNLYQQAQNEKKHEATIMLVTYRLEQLEKSVAKHNSVVERTYKLEQAQRVTEEQIKVANHRISDLEKGDDIK